MEHPIAASLPAFESLYEHSADSVLILAENGRQILDANPRAAEMLGMTRQQLVGKDVADYLSRDLKELTAFAKAIHNHGVVWTDTFSIPGDHPKPVDVSASGFELPDGRFMMLVLHEALAPADEKTRAAKAAEVTAEYYRERMERFERDVLNQTAHDIRTPLTPILLQLAVLERNLGPILGAGDKVAIEVIRRNVARLEEHIQAVLRAARGSE